MAATVSSATPKGEGKGGGTYHGRGVRKRKRAGVSSRVFAVIALAPFVLFGLIFAAYPIAQVVRMAVSDVRIRSGELLWDFTGLTNVMRVFDDAASWQSIGNTVIFIVATVVLSLIVGLVMALLVDRAVIILPLARNVLIWPAVIAPVIVSLMWLLILSPTVGGLNKVLRTLSLDEQGWLGQGATAMAAVVLVDVWHWTPVVFLFMYTAIKSVDLSVLEAARVDGANEFAIIRRVVLPLLAPAIGAVILVRIIMGVKAFDEMYLLTRGGPDGATTLVSQHIKTLFFDNLQLGEASAFSLAIVIVTAVILGIFLFARSKAQN
jgi:multiple sugar transport system permease protein